MRVFHLLQIQRCRRIQTQDEREREQKQKLQEEEGVLDIFDKDTRPILPSDWNNGAADDNLFLLKSSKVDKK